MLKKSTIGALAIVVIAMLLSGWALWAVTVFMPEMIEWMR